MRARGPDRQELGAQALDSLVLDDGRLREAWSDVAPGLEGGLEDWLRGRRHVVAGAGARRAESSALAVALLEARPVVLVLGAEEGGRDEGLGRACIDADGAPPRAAIALPVLRGAEVVAVLWMEFAHRLLPSAERLADDEITPAPGRSASEPAAVEMQAEADPDENAVREVAVDASLPWEGKGRRADWCALRKAGRSAMVPWMSTV